MLVDDDGTDTTTNLTEDNYLQIQFNLLNSATNELLDKMFKRNTLLV
jgi:hypothetical protein